MGVLSRYLLVQSHQLKSVWNLFRVNKKTHQRSVIDVVLMSLVINLTELVNCSGVSFVDFEQVNTGWVVLLFLLLILNNYMLAKSHRRKHFLSFHWRGKILGNMFKVTSEGTMILIFLVSLFPTFNQFQIML